MCFQPNKNHPAEAATTQMPWRKIQDTEDHGEAVAAPCLSLRPTFSAVSPSESKASQQESQKDENENNVSLKGIFSLLSRMCRCCFCCCSRFEANSDTCVDIFLPMPSHLRRPFIPLPFFFHWILGNDFLDQLLFVVHVLFVAVIIRNQKWMVCSGKCDRNGMMSTTTF